MATKEEKLEKLKKAKKDYQEKVIKAGKKAKEKLKKTAKKAGKAIGDSGVGTKIVAATAALTLGGAMNDANAQTYQGGTGTTKTVTMNGITFQMSTPTPEEQARLDATNRARQQATGRAPQSGYTQSGGYRQNQGGYQSGGYAQNRGTTYQMGGYSQQQIYSTLSDYAREQVDLEYGGMSAIAPAEYQKGLNDPANGILYAVAVWSYSRPGKLDFIPIDVFYSVVSDRGSNRDWRRVPKATGIDPNRALTMRSDHAGPFKPYGVDARFTRRAPDRVQMNVNTGYGSVRSNSRGDTRVQVPGVGGVTVNQRGVPTRIDIKTRKGSRHR